jgi:hypothetical protein
MTWIRRLWFAAAVVGVVGAVAVFLGAVYGGAGLSVDDISVSESTPTNTSANCADTIVRTVDVTVAVSRSGVRPRNPQWWEVGIRVRATVFEGAKQRTLSIAPGSETSVTIPFQNVQDRQWAPRENVEVVVQITKGQAEIADETLTATFQPVKAGQNC